MQASFLGEIDRASDFRVAIDVTPAPSRESIKLLAIGSRKGVMHFIHVLHVRGFAEAGAWSPLLPGPNPGEVMSILTLSFLVE